MIVLPLSHARRRFDLHCHSAEPKNWSFFHKESYSHTQQIIYFDCLSDEPQRVRTAGLVLQEEREQTGNFQQKLEAEARSAQLYLSRSLPISAEEDFSFGSSDVAPIGAENNQGFVLIVLVSSAKKQHPG